MPLSNATAIAPTPGYALPFTWEWNLTIDQAIGQQTLSAGYVGALGRRLDAYFEPPSTGGGTIFISNDGRSSYNSLQLQFSRRLSTHLHMLVSYTWGHSFDNISTDWPYSATTVISSSPFKRGSSDFDIRQGLNGSIIAALPSPHAGLAALLFRNWTANSLFFARSALPIDVAVQSDLQRPDLVPGQPLYLHGSGYPGGKIVNSAAFAVPPNLQDGDLGRNVLRGFGAWQIDFSLHREVPLSDHLHLEFRVETFNILNHPNFGDPSAPGAPGVILLGSGAGFGTSGQTLANSLGPDNVLGQLSPVFQIGGPRTIQFAVRLRF